jgi:hypothetical protein
MLNRLRLVRSCALPAAFIAIGLGALSDAVAHDIWINRERRVNAQGEWCCNQHDCEPIAAELVKESRVGFALVDSGEVVPYSEAQVSGDGQYWRCKRPNRTTRCFFYPPPGS